MIFPLPKIITFPPGGRNVLCPGEAFLIEQARDNLREALELFFETASPEETQRRLGGEIFVTQIEVSVG